MPLLRSPKARDAHAATKVEREEAIKQLRGHVSSSDDQSSELRTQLRASEGSASDLRVERESVRNKTPTHARTHARTVPQR